MKEEVPNIKVEPPGPKAKEILEREKKYYAQVQMKVFDNLVFEDCENAVVTDPDGNKFIDMASGISVMHTGHCNPKIVEASKKQLDKYNHIGCFIGACEPIVDYCEKLSEIAPMDNAKVWFCNTGAEAVESAVKTARYAQLKDAEKAKLGMISFIGSFHGRSLQTISLTTSHEHLREGFSPLLTGTTNLPYANCYRCMFDLTYPECDMQCARNIETHLKTNISPKDTAAMIAEPIQGEGGIVMPPKEWYEYIREICDEHDILFIADEVWMGFGRTGKWYSIQHYDIEPDIISFAKSHGGGNPLGGVIVNEKVNEKLDLGMHGTTFGGNPISCVSGMASMEVIKENNLLDRATELGEFSEKRLKEMQEDLDIIGDVRVKGLAIGLDLVKDRDTKEPISPETWGNVVNGLLKKGILTMHPGGVAGSKVFRMAPALTIEKELLEKAFDLIGETLKEVQ